ncbi:hypothetical protein HY636_05885 [Candidatus Woesearchaeota archaeon]|nr:hypothetical protein [Candidatus Woesearchaeota archaeon]
MPQGVEGYAAYSSVSPIGSTADSPLKVAALTSAHGGGMPPNYGLPNQRYEDGGALRFSATESSSVRGYSSPLIKDPFDITRGMYGKGNTPGKSDELDRLSLVLGKYFVQDINQQYLH